jgi:hypothetical protein
MRSIILLTHLAIDMVGRRGGGRKISDNFKLKEGAGRGPKLTRGRLHNTVDVVLSL